MDADITLLTPLQGLEVKYKCSTKHTDMPHAERVFLASTGPH